MTSSTAILRTVCAVNPRARVHSQQVVAYIYIIYIYIYIFTYLSIYLYTVLTSMSEGQPSSIAILRVVCVAA